ncbi:hypothetical protein A2U01_0106004, partial [Trifolium medium]|nr:hypothetical protein [Trifolium medium]
SGGIAVDPAKVDAVSQWERLNLYRRLGVFLD